MATFENLRKEVDNSKQKMIKIIRLLFYDCPNALEVFSSCTASKQQHGCFPVKFANFLKSNYFKHMRTTIS